MSRRKQEQEKAPVRSSVAVPITDEKTWRAIEARAMKAGYKRNRSGVPSANMSAYMRDLAAGYIDAAGRKRKAGEA